MKPTFEYEDKLWKRGEEFVVGMDEVGRGCFAGPVVAGAVVFSPDIKKIFSGESEVIIRDSKKMTKLQREKANEWIINNALTYGIGEAGVEEINEFGINEAVYSAFRRAVRQAQLRVNMRTIYMLIDAIYIPDIGNIHRVPSDRDIRKVMPKSIDQLAVKKGDERSFTIAASSIVAKVYRDNIMKELGQKTKYHHYQWNKNKGYGTKIHRDQILKKGLTKHHRTQYVSTFLKNHTKNN